MISFQGLQFLQQSGYIYVFSFCFNSGIVNVCQQSCVGYIIQIEKKRVKPNDADSRLSHRQKLTLLTGTLAHKVVIVSKNSNIFIEIKVLSFVLFQFEKKKAVKIVLNFSHLPCHGHHMTYDVCCTASVDSLI